MPTDESAGVPTEESAPAGQQAPRVPVANQPAAGPPVAEGQPAGAIQPDLVLTEGQDSDNGPAPVPLTRVVTCLILHQHCLSDLKWWEVGGAGAKTFVVLGGAPTQGLLPPCSDVVPSRPQVGEGAQRRCQGTIGEKIPKLTTKEKLGWGHTSSPVRRIPVLKQSSGELYGIQAAVGADVVSDQPLGRFHRNLRAAVGMREGHRGQAVRDPMLPHEVLHRTSHELWTTVAGECLRYTEVPA